MHNMIMVKCNRYKELYCLKEDNIIKIVAPHISGSFKLDSLLNTMQNPRSETKIIGTIR